jgi:hypothetical protein
MRCLENEAADAREARALISSARYRLTAATTAQACWNDACPCDATPA